MPFSQFLAVWLIRKAHSVVLRAVTVPSTLKFHMNSCREVAGSSICTICAWLESYKFLCDNLHHPQMTPKLFQVFS